MHVPAGCGIVAVMRVEEALHRLGGVADAGTLVRATSRSRVRTALAAGEVVRDTRGRYSLPHADEARRAANALSGVVSHESAALLHGWKLKHPPARPVVTVPRKRRVAPGRRRGVDVHWRDLAPDEEWCGVTTAATTVLDCARTMPFDEALAVADSALRDEAVTSDELIRLAEDLPRIGRRQALLVVREASGLAANPFESVLRAIALGVPGIHVRPQVIIRDGAWSVRPDLVDERLMIVLEADSFEFHGRRRQMHDDCGRYNGLVVRGWLVLRFSWEHVMLEPDEVAAWIAEAVAMRTTAGRARPLGQAAPAESA